MAETGAEVVDLPALVARVGTRLGASAWQEVTQAMVDAHAESSGDHYWLHTDPARARTASPTGTTIAHGYMTLSLLSAMSYQVMPALDGERMVLNYGLDRLRFLAPVPVGARVRGVFDLKRVEERRPGEVTITCAVAVEIEGAARPALVATWLHRRFLTAEGDKT